MIKRRRTRQVKLGNVRIGGSAPITVESMAKTTTCDVRATIDEIKRLKDAGCEIVRLAVKNEEDLSRLGRIKRAARIPLVADIHFNYRLALGAIDRGIDGIRLNPGNIFKKDEVKEIIKKAKEKRVPIRIGANSGSLRIERKELSEDKLMVKSVLEYLKYFEEERFHDIIISLKSSSVLSTISAYRQMAKLCDYPFHVGITATGSGTDGIVKSALGIGILLLDGIGDTIRVSLTSDSVDEVETAKSILQSLGLRSFKPDIISCPTCGRCQVDLIKITQRLNDKLSAFSFQLSAKRPITIAVMGCEVNGPGEAKDADIGIAAGKASGVFFKKGNVVKKIKEKDFIKEIIREVKLRAESR